MVTALAGGSLKVETFDVASYALVSQNPSNAIFPPQKPVRPSVSLPPARPALPGNETQKGLGTKLGTAMAVPVAPALSLQPYNTC